MLAGLSRQLAALPAADCELLQAAPAAILAEHAAKSLQVFDFGPERPRRKTKVLNSRGVIEHEILIHAPRHGRSEMAKGWQQPSAANRSTTNGRRQSYNEPPFPECIKDAADHFIIA